MRKVIKYFLKKISFFILIPVSKRYLAKERTFKFKNILVKVAPGVFHPGFFFSTRNLLKFLEEEPLDNKTFLELGAGSGIISVFASKKKAKVISSDISITAVRNIKENLAINSVDAKVIHSDLFEKIPLVKFDYIVINPPYYNKSPMNEKDYAWYCGEDFQFFRRLFKQIPQYMGKDSKVIIILSEECELEKIKSIADNSNIELREEKKIRNWQEWNYIYRLKDLGC